MEIWEVSAFVSTGTEAVRLALRIARATIGRARLVKFHSHYHGWFDNVHVLIRPATDGPATIGRDAHAADALTILARANRDGILHLTGALLCRGIQAIPRGLMYLSAAR